MILALGRVFQFVRIIWMLIIYCEYYFWIISYNLYDILLSENSISSSLLNHFKHCAISRFKCRLRFLQYIYLPYFGHFGSGCCCTSCYYFIVLSWSLFWWNLCHLRQRRRWKWRREARRNKGNDRTKWINQFSWRMKFSFNTLQCQPIISKYQPWHIIWLIFYFSNWTFNFNEWFESVTPKDSYQENHLCCHNVDRLGHGVLAISMMLDCDQKLVHQSFCNRYLKQ